MYSGTGPSDQTLRKENPNLVHQHGALSHLLLLSRFLVLTEGHWSGFARMVLSQSPLISDNSPSLPLSSPRRIFLLGTVLRLTGSPQNMFTRKNQGRMKAITRQAIKKLQRGWPLQHLALWGASPPPPPPPSPPSPPLLSLHSSRNPPSSTPVTFFATSPQISQDLVHTAERNPFRPG